MTLQEALKYSTNRTHSDFIDAALAQPESEVHPLVYADWLQEQGQEGLAEHIRRAVKRKGMMVVAVPTFEAPVSVTTDKSRPAGVTVTTHHRGTGPKTIMYQNFYPIAEAVSLLRGMPEVEGASASSNKLVRKYPHLFQTTKIEAGQEPDAQTDLKQYRS